MPSGTLDKGKPGAISRHQDTDYHMAWLAFLKQSDAVTRTVLDRYVLAEQNELLTNLRSAFDAGWEARGLADLAIIDKHTYG